jgi:hypothetical protein
MPKTARTWSYLLVAFIVCAAQAGCGGPKQLPTAEVAGTVNLDGKPLPDGEILFADVAQGANNILPIKDGKFSGRATVGQLRVEIRAYRDVAGNTEMYGSGAESSKENYLPAQYNTESTLNATVPKEGAKALEFAVTAS